MKTKEDRAREYNRDLKDALRTLWDFTNNGQKKQALKNGTLKAALKRFGIVEDDK